MKKFFSLVLALVMALSLTTVAWGASATTADEVQTAFNAGENVVLSNGFAVSSTLTVPADKTVVLDLNGKEITYAGTDPLFDVKGNLTVKNGTITSTGSGVLFYGNNGSTANKGTSEAELTLIDLDVTAGSYFVFSNTAAPGWNKVTITGGDYTSSAHGFTLDMAWDGVVTMTDVVATTGANVLVEVGGYGYATATITNCTFTTAGTGVLGYTIGASYGTQMTINGGTYVGADIVAQAHETTYNGGPVPTVTINGGSFTGKLESNPAGGTDEGEIVVSGGTFDDPNVSDYVADGYRLVNGTVVAVPANTNGVVGGYQGQLTVKDAPRQAITNFTKTAAVTPDDVNEDGLYNMPGDVMGSIEYYTFNLGGAVAQNYYQVDSVNDADLIVYVGDSLVPYMYLANEPAGGFQYIYGVASFNDFGSACGQFKYVDYDATKSYYTYAGQVYVLANDGAVNLKVGTKFVQANNITASGKFVAHTPVFTQNDKGVVTAVSCAKCSDVGVIVANYAALPTAMKAPGMNFQLPGSTSKYYYWVDTAAVVTPSTDKVTSAETFDAGIAMYVGMSVLAATGSAVVIGKKRER